MNKLVSFMENCYSISLFSIQLIISVQHTIFNNGYNVLHNQYNGPLDL